MVFLLYLPEILLGGNSVVPVHDQLDGELLVYLLRAKHFGESFLPEFMSGMEATALTPASPGSLLFYLALPPYAAFIVNKLFVALAAFCGMYLCLQFWFKRSWLSLAVGVLFAMLPFYSVYGLSVMGQPLVLYAVLRLFREEKPAWSLLPIVLFGAFSSPVLVGYADCLFLLAAAVVLSVLRRREAKWVWILSGVLIAVYVVLNFSLLRQMLLPGGVVSHKTELVVAAQSAKAAFQQLFKEGMYHSASLHTQMIPWVLAVFCGGWLLFGCLSKRERNRLYILSGLLAVAVGIALFYAVWWWAPIVALRNQLGGLFTSFQVDRFYWLYPCLWFLMLGFVLYFIRRASTLAGNTHSLPAKAVSVVLVVVLLCTTGSTVYSESTLKKNLAHASATEETVNVNTVTWNEFYSTALFDEIKAYINKPLETYKVASLGLYPSVALYNGFYCIDGYSNNYDVEYKHEFRKIIAAELEKNATIQSYFDAWGNRCYLFSSELGKQYFFTKEQNVTVKDLELSGEALRALDCSYILSGVQIEQPGRSGLVFLSDFEADNSPYHIYLYAVQAAQ